MKTQLEFRECVRLYWRLRQGGEGGYIGIGGKATASPTGHRNGPSAHEQGGQLVRSQAQPQLINATPIGGEKGTALPLAVFATILACALACLGIGASAAGAAPSAQPGYGFIGSFGAGDT